MTATHLTKRDQRLAFAVAMVVAQLRDGGEPRVVDVPDVKDRENPAVELITADDVGRLAIEHTVIEPFEHEIRERPRVGAYEIGLRERLAGRLPPRSRFNLVIAVLATDGVKPTRDRLDKIAEWVEREARRLEDGSPQASPRHWVRGGPPDLPFEATLYRWPRPPDSSLPLFSVLVAAPEELEARRVARVAQALERKLPKLREAAGQEGEGVLVLESEDIQLSNSWTIAVAVREAVSSAASWVPEWIVLVETDTSTPIAWVLRGRGEWIDEIEPRPLPTESIPSGEAVGDAVRQP
jgi:hypothetical protein